MNCECAFIPIDEFDGHWVCCVCEGEYCPLDTEGYGGRMDFVTIDAGHDCAEQGCIEPIYDRRITDLAPRKGTECRCHPNVIQVVHGDENEVVACGCSETHTLCLDCLRDPIQVTHQDMMAQQMKNPQLNKTQAYRAAYQEKLVVQKLEELKVTDEQ